MKQAAAAVARGLQFIRFSHTIFALPFALGAMLVAADGFPPLRTAALILLAMVTARTAAMTFNRLADWELDRRNPRTEGRHRLVSRQAAFAMLLISTAGFVAASALINRVCLVLSPVALVLIFGYSLTKRFTNFSHFYLGLALAASPVGAWLAVRGAFALPPLVLAAAVVLWVAGFDLIYATQDYEFDRENRLHSLVVAVGIPRALIIAQWLHAATWVLLGGFGLAADLGGIYALGMTGIAVVLWWEHRAAAGRQLAAINQAFFAANAVVGLIFVSTIFLEVLT